MDYLGILRLSGWWLLFAVAAVAVTRHRRQLRLGEARQRADAAKISGLAEDNRQLRGQVAALDNILLEADQALAAFDRHGRLFFANPAAEIFLRASRRGALGRKYWEILAGVVPCRMVEQVLEGGERAEETLAMEGGARVFLLRVRRVDFGLVLSAGDRTREAGAEKMRREFTAAASHEIRSPLAVIAGALETIAPSLPADAGPFLRMAEQQVERLKALAGDLLRLTGAETEKSLYLFEAVSLERICRDAAPAYESGARRRGITIHWRITGEVPEVRGDRRRLEQVLANLLDNALRYTGSSGRITVGAKQRGDEVTVSVSNSGEGIPAGDLPRIFERFYRVEKGRSRRLGGTGLGLAIVKHIVENHRGRAWAESAPGQLTTFHFTLPVYRAGCPPEDRRKPPRGGDCVEA